MNKIYFITALLLCLTVFQKANAQAVMQANPDNFFVPPNATSTTSSLDILANDFYGDYCGIADLTVTVKTGADGPQKGYAWYNATTRTLNYLPTVNSGTDSLVYTLKCPSSPQVETKVYININNRPGVVSDADCYVEPDPVVFDIGLIAQSDPTEYNVSSLSFVLTGDIDNDGKIEMIVMGMATNSQNIAQNILVYNYDPDDTDGYKLNIKYTIPVSFTQWPNNCVSIAKITGGTVNTTSTASIFFAHPLEKKLYRYDLTGANYTETWSVPLNTNIRYSKAAPFIADLMGNGRQQVICTDKIYDADTGTLLVEATRPDGTLITPTTGRDTFYSFGCYGHSLTDGITFESAMIPADIDGDGLPELVGGDCIYKVNIDDFTTNNTTLNTYRLYRKANYKSDLTTQWDSGRTDIGEGGVAVVDVDNDGQLEVVVTGTMGGIEATGPTDSGRIFIYNPRTGEIMHTNAITNIARSAANKYGPSRPFVGDIDGDGYPEFCLTGYLTFRAYKLDIAGKLLKEMWRTTTTDSSASTTLSMFDFSQDGIARMIYRDITSLRIIRSAGNASTDEFTFSPIYSGTLNEYPIVIDVDGDGHAEILTTGTTDPAANVSNWGRNGTLRIYGPPSGADMWAPARRVWNQGSYNPVYVNDDLTIPARPLSPATKFVASDGTVSRPFNNFLQQATELNKEGTMITEGPDLTFKPGAPRKQIWGTDGSLTIQVVLTNIGGTDFTGPIEFQLYSYVGVTNPVYTAVGSPHILPNTTGFAPNAEQTVTINTPAAQLPSTLVDGYAITVNLSSDPGAAPVYKGTTECHDGYNNRALGFNVIDGMTILCQGSSGTVTANPTGKYNIYWYKPGNSVAENSTPSDTYYYTNKDSEPVSYMLVQAFNGINPVSPLKDTIYIYRAPDSLVWNNAIGNNDWHDQRNWTNPDDQANLYPMAKVPQLCTNVLIPNTTTDFPDLSATSTLEYQPFGVPSADSIYFSFGGEIKRPELLAYNKAFVDVDFTTHRWYMFAPPLKNFYAGDLYLDNPIPSKDQVMAYTRLWGAPHPWGSYFESKWTPLFSQPGVTFNAGQAMGLWISDNLDREMVHKFRFPKNDLTYNVYFEGTENINPYYPTTSTPRTNAGRFIFDTMGTAGADFQLNAEAKENNSMVMVANPFMAHLDFDLFFAKNSSKIKNQYRILNANGSDFLYYKQGYPAASQLDKYIAPMQAFIVEAKTKFNTLDINGAMTQIVPGSTLRSTQEKMQIILPVTLTQMGATAKTFIGFGENFEDGYNQNEDIMALFANKNDGIKPISAYSLDKEYNKMNLNNLSEKYILNGGIIPIGIRTPEDKKVTINIGNIAALPQNAGIYIIDAYTDKEYDLRKQSMYTFDQIKTDSELFCDNRFFLKIVSTDTHIENTLDQENYNIWVRVQNNYASITAGEKILKICIYNVHGQKVDEQKPMAGYTKIKLPGKGLYIINIETKDRKMTRKVINF